MKNRYQFNQNEFLNDQHIKKGAHGGAHSIQKRRKKRPIRVNKPLHVTLRSDLARGSRSLLKNRSLIFRVLKQAAFRFKIKIYQKAICGNHIHLLIRGKHRASIQNFFRVVAGQIAQEILRQYPLSAREAIQRTNRNLRIDKKTYSLKNQRKFWDLVIWSRRVSWGRDFKNVYRYIIKNFLEAVCIIPYTPRAVKPRKRIPIPLTG